MTFIDPPQEVGRCQHCQQIRPIWHYDLRHDNGDEIWAKPYPPYWMTTGAWLCASDWDAAETCRVQGRAFHVEHELVVFAEHEPRTRTWGPGGEVLTPTQRDLATCKAIYAATT
ncbi:hypothetical protein OG552_10290 [Streptomyces sp. NBC_01476]|uniref:hypothetical protein n=1 Tax=Streptomyces sp. NBC_01476 TaxID=2903881 RepID=UPI002E363237|nr:hypothetical protein [Streptomyces sp. NBC_01476]